MFMGFFMADTRTSPGDRPFLVRISVRSRLISPEKTATSWGQETISWGSLENFSAISGRIGKKILTTLPYGFIISTN